MYHEAASRFLFGHFTLASFFKLYLVMLFVFLTDIRLDISNSYIAPGWSAVFCIFHRNWIDTISSKRYEGQKLIAFIFFNKIQHPQILKNNIDHSGKQDHHQFFIKIPILYMAKFWSSLSAKPMLCLYQSN